MNKQVKKAVAIAGAFALVVVAGEFMSDYSMKATDGQENIVKQESPAASLGKSNAEESYEEITIDDAADEAIEDSSDVTE